MFVNKKRLLCFLSFLFHFFHCEEKTGEEYSGGAHMYDGLHVANDDYMVNGFGEFILLVAK